jgi:Tfp pilus assembly PilM family ATPase
MGTMEFFTETTQGAEVKEVFLTGGASLTLGLLEALSESLKLPVKYMNALKNITPSNSVLKTNSERDLQYKSAVALGLSLRKAGDAL